MMVADPAPIVCPSCGGTNTNIGASGSAICRDCAHLWDPDNPVAPTSLEQVETAAAAYDEAYGRTELDQQLGPALSHDEMIGGGAVLEGGQVATVESFTNDDHVIVRLTNGDLEKVALADVLRIMPPVVIPDPPDIPDEPGGLAPDLQLALVLAQLIVRAGVEAVDTSDGGWNLIAPPTGYLPPEGELLEVVERAAAMAVATLIEMFELDTDQILDAVGAWSDTPDEEIDSDDARE